MKRNLIKQKTAFTLTLPIEWIRENNLKEKDELELTIEKDQLIISPEKKESKKEIIINLEKGIEDYYRIMIEGPYLRGYDKIVINLKEKEQFKYLQKITSNLIGFEIINHNKNYCEIAQTSEPTEDQFKNILNRAINIITYTQETIKENLIKKSFKNLEEIKNQSDDTRRFLLFCTRTLHKKRITTRENESFIHLLLERLILIEHNYYYLAKKINKISSIKINKNIITLYGEITEMFNLFKKIFYKKEITHFTKINKIWEKIYFNKNLLEKLNQEESIITYHLIHLSKLIFLISQPNLTIY